MGTIRSYNTSYALTMCHIRTFNLHHRSRHPMLDGFITPFPITTGFELSWVPNFFPCSILFSFGSVTGCTRALGVMNLISSEATIAQCSQGLLMPSSAGEIMLQHPADEGQNSCPGFCTFLPLALHT